MLSDDRQGKIMHLKFHRNRYSASWENQKLLSEKHCDDQTLIYSIYTKNQQQFIFIEYHYNSIYFLSSDL